MQTLHTKEPVQRLIKCFGGQRETADAIGVEQGTISGWLNLKHGISEKNALKAEKLTGKKVMATELCPALAEVME